MAEDNNTGIDAELRTNKEKLESIKNIVDERNKEQQEIQQYVKELEKFNNEIKLAEDAYEKTFSEKSSLEKIANKKVLDDEVKELLPQIDEVARRLDKDSGSPVKQLKDLDVKQSALKAELTAAKASVEQAQKTYDELRARQKNIEANLKTVRDLKTAVERDQQDNKPAAYYALDNMRKQLHDLSLKDPAEFTRDLENAGKALADASREARLKTVEFERVKVAYDDAKVKESRYRDDVAGELRKLKIPAQVKQQSQQKTPQQARQPAQASAPSSTTP